jgi:hypothetical protein
LISATWRSKRRRPEVRNGISVEILQDIKNLRLGRNWIESDKHLKELVSRPTRSVRESNSISGE